VIREREKNIFVCDFVRAKHDDEDTLGLTLRVDFTRWSMWLRALADVRWNKIK